MVFDFFFLFYSFGERKNVEVGEDLKRDGGGGEKDDQNMLYNNFKTKNILIKI